MHIHLIRHGEVENPGNVVYANIPGFVLSAKGRDQARSTGKHLARSGLGLIVASPLDRAVETARLIAAETGAEIETDPRLTEWALAVRWRGALWAELPTVFPGELEAYLEDPRNLPFCPESIDDVAVRITTAVSEWVARSVRDVGFVSHEDPIHATYLSLTAAHPTAFHADKPAHCSVTTLAADDGKWRTVSRWAPQQ
jgi:broad specificity phosphatase PhoE